MTTPDRTPDGWSTAARQYDLHVTKLTTPFARQIVTSLGLAAGHRFLDVAAGTGALTLAAAATGAQVMATDFAPAMLDRLRLRLEANNVRGVETAVMDGQALDVADQSFDMAGSNFGVIFFPDRGRGFKELYRVLRLGGRAGITAWAEADKNPGLALFGQAVQEALPDLPRATEPPAVLSLADPSTFAGELRRAGFSEVELQPVASAWTFPSPEAVWDELHAASPVFSAVLERAGDRVADVRAALVARVRREHGDGPVRLPALAWLAIASK